MLISILQVRPWRSGEVEKLTQGYMASRGEAKVGSQVGVASRLCQQADLLHVGSKREARGNSGRGGCRWSPQSAFTHCRNPSYSGAQSAWGASRGAHLAPSFLPLCSGLSSALSMWEPMNERCPSVLCRKMAFVPWVSRPPTCPPAVASPCGFLGLSSSGLTTPSLTLATTGWVAPLPPRLSAWMPGLSSSSGLNPSPQPPPYPRPAGGSLCAASLDSVFCWLLDFLSQ